MSSEQYEYEYHDVAEDADYIDQEDSVYYNDGSDEPWAGLDEEDDEGWDNYYHNIADEIDD